MTPGLVESFWRRHELRRGDRSQRLAAAELDWASEEVQDAVDSGAPGVVALLGELAEHSGADPVALGAGPLGDLLAQSASWDVQVAARCSRSPRWREATHSVHLDHPDRRPHLAPYLPGSRI